MFESSGKMSTMALSFFLAALRQVSNSFVMGLTSPNFSTNSSPGANTMTGQSTKMFGVERMLLTLMVNEHRKLSHSPLFICVWPASIFSFSFCFLCMLCFLSCISIVFCFGELPSLATTLSLLLCSAITASTCYSRI